MPILIYLKKNIADRRHCTFFRLALRLLSVSQNHIDDHHGSGEAKKVNLKFKLSVVKYVEENLGEAAARCFSADPERARDWSKK